jgi:cell division topological specificity factor
MNIFSLFGRKTSAPVARERLQILLSHERTTNCNADLIALLQKEVLAALAKHIDVDPSKVQIKMERREDVSLLEIDVEIPTPKDAKKEVAAEKTKVSLRTTRRAGQAA